MNIEKEIQQDEFINEFQKAHLNILITASWLNSKSNDILKPYDITWQQFNILRVLRGMSPQPATIKILTSKMIDKMSNASRLVEKLRKKEYVTRVEDTSDRRKVKITLTDKGKILLIQISQKIDATMDKSKWAISSDEAKELNELLDRIRENKT